MVCHWDDVEAVWREFGDLRATWRDLGRAAGSRAVGLQRVEVAPRARSTPVHVHGDEEETFFVLGGSGLSWQDGRAYGVARGDVIVHRICEEEHTLLAGGDGLDVLMFGERSKKDLAWLPRAGVSWAGPHWLPPGDHPFVREVAAGPLAAPAPEDGRPANIVALEDVPPEERRRGDVDQATRDVGDAAGSVRTGLTHIAVAPGALSNPPHCHAAEEELFVVLEGHGELLLEGEPPQPVRAGSVVARPAGTGVAHAFRGGEDGLAVLGYGQRVPNDICYYPRSGKLSVRGVKAIFRVQRVDYWDGEE
jgi:uncharacterized cupin superfamily protein